MKPQTITDWDYRSGSSPAGLYPSVVQQANRRRFRVFIGTLGVALAVSLGFTFLRPAEYRASARLEIAPVAALPGADAGKSADSTMAVSAQVQVLTSRPVLELVARQLEREGYSLAGFGSDPVASIQSRLAATALPNTNIVELVATGSRAEVVAALLNDLIEVYQGRLAESSRTSSSEALLAAGAEVDKLEATVRDKRRDVERFRTRYNIVSLERDENQLLAQVRSQNAALNAANDRVAAAEGKLRDVTEAVGAGKPVARARDESALAALEQRISQMRDEQTNLDRLYTPEYLARDANVKLARVRIGELERQLSTQREASKQGALASAQEELSSAQAAKRRAESQIAGDRQEVAQFTGRFNEYKSQQQALTQLEAAHRDAVQRKAMLEANERARTPTTRVLEAAATPTEPWRPQYWRDAAISGAGSLVLAFFAMGLVELFNRSDRQSSLIVTHRLAPGMPADSAASPMLAATSPGILPENSAPILLPRQSVFPRELVGEEMTSLLMAADADTRLLILLLLCGLSEEEVLGLRWSDIDLAHGVTHIAGDSGREIPLSEPLRSLLAGRTEATSDRVVKFHGRPATTDGVDAQILCAAYDAGLERAPEVTARALRHTYIAFLVRQGIRFSDLARLVGNLPVELLAAYATISGANSRTPLDAINLVLPAIRNREAA